MYVYMSSQQTNSFKTMSSFKHRPKNSKCYTTFVTRNLHVQIYHESLAFKEFTKEPFCGKRTFCVGTFFMTWGDGSKNILRIVNFRVLPNVNIVWKVFACKSYFEQIRIWKFNIVLLLKIQNLNMRNKAMLTHSVVHL